MDREIGIIALVPDSWAGIRMSRHQVLGRLARTFSIVWMEPANPWREYLRPNGPQFLKRDAWTAPLPGLDVLTPGWRHPLVFRPAILRHVTLQSRLATARRRLLARGAESILLYLWRDEFEEALDLVPHDASVYHIDDEYTFSDVDVPNSPRETRVLTRVNQVIVHSESLLAKKGGINPHTDRVPNGADYQAFSTASPEPPDLAAVPHPRIGYAGVIKKQIDLALLVRLAHSRPQYSFVMVGPLLNVAGKNEHVAALRSLPNVYMLGAKAPEQLPSYVQHFDVCLMCYEVNEYTKYIYSLKLHEYLATGRPVVSSRINSVIRYGDTIALAGSDAEWLQGIDACLVAGAFTPEAVQSRQAVARTHDWDVLVDRIAGILRATVRRTGAGQHRHAPSVRNYIS